MGAGVSAFGHHHAAVAVGVWRGWLAGPQCAGGFTQRGKQMLATRIRGVGVSGQELTVDTTEFMKEEHPGPVVDGEQRRVLDCGVERVPTG